VKLFVRTAFECDPETLWALFNDDAEFNERLEAASGVCREVVERHDEGDVQVWRLRCASKKELPKFMAKALGAKHLTYDQVSRFDRARNELQWDVVPTLLSDRVTATGVTRLIPGDGECERVIDGEITVRIPLIGGRIEKKLVEEIQGSYEKAAQIAADLIDEREA